MELRTARAYAPAAISNFFTIHYGGEFAATDLSHAGATGGGYMLSSGVVTRASVERSAANPGLSVAVNGDPAYQATTTRMAVQLLLDAIGEGDSRVELDQQVGVRISYGFGASAASALSAVMAVASALSSRLDREAVAYFAHAADILCRTGLGTVSVIYKYGGAGVIVKPGAPGIAEVRTVSAPKDVRVVTASLSPGIKGPLLSSPDLTKKVNRLGEESIRIASDLTLDGLIRAGESFSEGLGIASPQVRRLSRIAKSAGALGASQNMVGEAVHALVLERDVERVAAAMKSAEPSSEIGVYGLAPGPATLL
ncbi:MAG: hypothetical protein ABSG45_07300 [Nitrososphaerales archaeon]